MRVLTEMCNVTFIAFQRDLVRSSGRSQIISKLKKFYKHSNFFIVTWSGLICLDSLRISTLNIK